MYSSVNIYVHITCAPHIGESQISVALGGTFSFLTEIGLGEILKNKVTFENNFLLLEISAIDLTKHRVYRRT